VVVLPATSATPRLPVDALAVSVPDGMLVLSLKLASAAFARPEVASLLVQPRVLSVACQVPPAKAHVTVGACWSSLTVTTLLPGLVLTAASVAVWAVDDAALPRCSGSDRLGRWARPTARHCT
jgi:hypothetical protein